MALDTSPEAKGGAARQRPGDRPRSRLPAQHRALRAPAWSCASAVAGNAVNPRAQVVTAAGEGSAAAIALDAGLVEEDVREAVTRFRLGVPA